MEKTRIVILRSNPVNPDSRVEKEAKTLSNNGFFTTIIAWDREENYKSKKDILFDQIPIIRKGIKASFGDGMKNIIPFIKFQLYLLHWLIKNKKNYDIVHACDFDTAFITMIASFITRRKMVFDIFDYLSTDANNIFSKIIKFFEDSIINYADATIICTEERIKQIKDAKPKKMIVIHNTPSYKDVGFIVNNTKITKIVYVGILQDYRLLKEVANVIIKHPNLELHIAGFGKYEDYFVDLSDKYENIKFYGKISYEKAIELESQCDVMLAIYDPNIGNHIFAAPNKFYESLMLGKPVIMVKNTGMSSVVEKYDIGECIDYNQCSFEQGLLHLISRKNEWKTMHYKMKKLYLEDYSWHTMEIRLIGLYNDLFYGG